MTEEIVDWMFQRKFPCFFDPMRGRRKNPKKKHFFFKKEGSTISREARAGAQGLGQTPPGKGSIRVKKTILYEAHTFFTADMLIDLKIEAAEKIFGWKGVCCQSSNRCLPCWQQPPGLCKVSHSRHVHSNRSFNARTHVCPVM